MEKSKQIDVDDIIKQVGGKQSWSKLSYPLFTVEIEIPGDLCAPADPGSPGRIPSMQYGSEYPLISLASSWSASMTMTFRITIGGWNVANVTQPLPVLISLMKTLAYLLIACQFQ